MENELIDTEIQNYNSEKKATLWEICQGLFLSTPLAYIVCPQKKRVFDKVWARRDELSKRPTADTEKGEPPKPLDGSC